MSDASATKSLRERLATGTEDRLGRALSDLFDNPLLTGAVGRAFDAREKAAQAQELAMGALNLPSAADIERLTRRLRSLSQRLEGIEDGVERISRSLSAPKVEARLEQIEGQLQTLTEKLSDIRDTRAGTSPKRKATPRATPSSSKKTPARTPSPRSTAAKRKG
jgi:uncharacterized coiled-coil protein SlyX